MALGLVLMAAHPTADFLSGDDACQTGFERLRRLIAPMTVEWLDSKLIEDNQIDFLIAMRNIKFIENDYIQKEPG